MSSQFARYGGVWVPTGRSGIVRVSGASIPYAPPSGGTVDEAFAFPAPTGLNHDDSVRVNLGLVFTASIAGLWIGNRVFTTSVALPDLTVFAFNANTSAELARVTVIPPTATLLDVPFPEPVQLQPGVLYMAAYHAARYTFTAAAGMSWPYTTAHLSTEASSAPSRWQQGGPAGTVPANSSALGYQITPVVRFPT